jgi:hypothetical protein
VKFKKIVDKDQIKWVNIPWKLERERANPKGP